MNRPETEEEIYEFDSQRHMIDAYKDIEDEVRNKFKQLTTDTLQEIKKNLKRKQNKITLEQNKNLITQERQKIIAQMRAHKELCWYSQCKQINEIVLIYGFSKNMQLKDYVTYICQPGISGLGYQMSDCYYAKMLNDKMTETHRLIKGL